MPTDDEHRHPNVAARGSTGSAFLHRTARAATTAASVPVSSVGCTTGAKAAEWFTGMSRATRPARSAFS